MHGRKYSYKNAGTIMLHKNLLNNVCQVVIYFNLVLSLLPI
ncbi:MAG: hypothetical protein ACJAQ1_000861 [Flavobacterium sp.]|jgi:hypothetical protein